MGKGGGAWGGNTLVDPPDRENGVMSWGGQQGRQRGVDRGEKAGSEREKKLFLWRYT